MNATILVVDDDVEVRDVLARVLSTDNLHVDKARSADEALSYLELRIPDVMVLDINMPGMDGLTLCRQLRADARYIALPILFLTAQSETDDLVKGLEAGADDYVPKPFKSAEIRARVRALLRRASRDTGDRTALLSVGPLKLDPMVCQVYLQDKSIPLTATEYRLLRYMMERVNQPLSAQHLLQAVWEYPSDAGDPDLVRAHVRNLRSKLEGKNSNAHLIHTVHGVGYMIQG